MEDNKENIVPYRDTQEDVFEKELLDLNTHDDPLEVWVRYSDWILSTGNRDGAKTIVTRACEAFKHDKTYQNDARYLRQWLLLSRILGRKDSREIYLFLYESGIGQNQAAYFEAYASYLENLGHLYGAKSVYEEGIQNNARPINRLKLKYEEYLKKHNIRIDDHNNEEPWLIPAHYSLGILNGNEKQSNAGKIGVYIDKAPVHSIFQSSTWDKSTDKPFQLQQKQQIPAPKLTKDEILCPIEAFYHKNGEEICLEELRVSYKRYQIKESQEAVIFSPKNTDKVNANRASPTICTKAALSDIYNIFNQPLKCDIEDENSFEYSSSDDDELDNSMINEQEITERNESRAEHDRIDFDVNSQADDSQDEESETGSANDADITESTRASAVESFNLNDDVLSFQTASMIDDNDDEDNKDEPYIKTNRLLDFDDNDEISSPVSSYYNTPETPISVYEDPEVRRNLNFMTPITELTESVKSRFSLSDSSALKKKVITRRSPNNKSVQIARKSSQQIIEKSEIPVFPIYNPLDEKTRDFLLSQVWSSSACSNCFFVHDFAFPNVSYLTKFDNQDSTTTISLSAVKEDESKIIKFDDNRKFHVLKKLGEGAFGKVYLIKSTLCEKMQALKMEDKSCRWEFYITKTLSSRLLNDRDHNSIMRVHELHAFTDNNYMLLDYWSHGTILDVVNKSFEDGKYNMDELLAIFLSSELLRIMLKMHALNILHGDLKPDNCLLRLTREYDDKSWDMLYDRDGQNGWRDQGICVIDFGRSISIDLYGKDAKYQGDWDTDQQDCIEMQKNKPWTYQVDYHGLACVLHCLLFGSYLETVGNKNNSSNSNNESGESARIKLKNPLKRYWQTEIWSGLFDLLLNSAALYGESALPISSKLEIYLLRMQTYLEKHSTKGRGLKRMLIDLM